MLFVTVSRFVMQTSEIVYVVVTEEWYGGDDKIGVFDNLDVAHAYRDDLVARTNGKYDVLIYEKDLRNRTHHAFADKPEVAEAVLQN
jgi:hypothetical protein